MERKTVWIVYADLIASPSQSQNRSWEVGRLKMGWGAKDRGLPNTWALVATRTKVCEIPPTCGTRSKANWPITTNHECGCESRLGIVSKRPCPRGAKRGRLLFMQPHLATQFSVFLVNKPGVLAQVTRALADEKVNLVAMTLVDSQEHGVLRMVSESPDQARTALTSLNLPMTETDVLCLELSNDPGALADIAGRLGQNHVNINYAYCTSGAPGGKTTGIFKVADPAKAQKILKEGSKAHKEPDLHRGRGRR